MKRSNDGNIDEDSDCIVYSDGGEDSFDEDEEGSTSSGQDDVALNLDNTNSLNCASSGGKADDYRIFTEAELREEMNKQTAETSAIIRFYEAQDAEAFFRTANLLKPDKGMKSTSENRALSCKICFDSKPLTGLQCGHLFCRDCWAGYLACKIVDEGRPCVACPQYKCSIILDDDKALGLISTGQVKRAYNKLVLNSFVESNSLLKWCPGTGCGRAVKVPHAEPCPITCQCSYTFCFQCAEQWHEPVNCALLRRWLKKCSDDSETSNWLNANTKDCPECHVTIEKDGGCNHMTCKNVSCKFEFCWMCLGPWAPHGAGWYSCNRFDDDIAKKARDDQERSRAALQRYLHYYNRYVNHHNSLKLESRLYTQVNNTMELMQVNGMSWIETQFLMKAVDVLSECRRTLMYTYAFAYYLQQNNITKIFEDNQQDLEIATEQLSEFLERDLQGLETENLVMLKQKVQDKYRYVEQRRSLLLKHCAEGYENSQWVFVKENAQNGAPPPTHNPPRQHGKR